jgi:hypothetical protein
MGLKQSALFGFEVPVKDRAKRLGPTVKGNVRHETKAAMIDANHRNLMRGEFASHPQHGPVTAHDDRQIDPGGQRRAGILCIVGGSLQTWVASGLVATSRSAYNREAPIPQKMLDAVKRLIDSFGEESAN